MFKLENYNLDINSIQGSMRKNLSESLRILERGLSFIDNPNIISIGSGAAYFEKCVSTMLDKEIICVDPKPNDYENRETFVKPKYKTVDEISQEEVEKFNFVFLIWPSPQNCQRDYKNVPHNTSGCYDFDALKKILPDGFFVVYAPCGASGSDKFINCLNGDNGKITDDFMNTSAPYINYSQLEFKLENEVASKTYKCVSSLKIVEGEGYGFNGITQVFACFVNNSLVNKSHEGVHNMRREPYMDNGCFIM